MCVSFFVFFVFLPFCIFAIILLYTCGNMDSFGKTVTVQTPPELRRFTQATVLPGILNNLGKDAVSSVQFFPGGSFRASFSTSEHKVMIENKGRFNIGKHEYTV